MFESEHIIRIGDTESPESQEVSISKLNVRRRCQYKYKYKYIDKIRPKKKAIQLRRGGWIHLLLEEKDSGRDWMEKLKSLKKDEFDKLFLEEQVEIGDLPKEVYRIMRAYHQTYLEVDKEWETIICEQDFKIRLGNTKFVAVGKIDKIALHKKSGKIWLWEHKTMKKAPPSEAFRFTDTQTAFYMWVLTKIIKQMGYKPSDIGGIMFDYIRTKPPTQPRLLKAGTMSKARIDCDKWSYMAALKKNHLNPEDYAEFIGTLDSNILFTRIPMAKSAEMIKTTVRDFMNTCIQMQEQEESGTPLVRTIDWTCDMFKCEYLDLCKADMEGLDTTVMIQMEFEPKEVDDVAKKDEEN